jgi:hypothetical protein
MLGKHYNSNSICFNFNLFQRKNNNIKNMNNYNIIIINKILIYLHNLMHHLFGF